MKRLFLAALLALSVGGVAEAKKKKKKPVATQSDGDKAKNAKLTDDKSYKKDDTLRPRPPGDKGQNDGAQGRKNATEDESRAAEQPNSERQP